MVVTPIMTGKRGRPRLRCFSGVLLSVPSLGRGGGKVFSFVPSVSDLFGDRLLISFVHGFRAASSFRDSGHLVNVAISPRSKFVSIGGYSFPVYFSRFIGAI